MIIKFIYNNFKFFLKSAMDKFFCYSQKRSGQSIIEYTVFISMFVLGVMAIANQATLQRVIQGRMRSSLAQSMGVEQFDEATTTPDYDADVSVFETPASTVTGTRYPNNIIINPGDGAAHLADIDSIP